MGTFPSDYNGDEVSAQKYLKITLSYHDNMQVNSLKSMRIAATSLQEKKAAP
jgi:hypothetical protein